MIGNELVLLFEYHESVCEIRYIACDIALTIQLRLARLVLYNEEPDDSCHKECVEEQQIWRANKDEAAAALVLAAQERSRT